MQKIIYFALTFIIIFLLAPIVTKFYFFVQYQPKKGDFSTTITEDLFENRNEEIRNKFQIVLNQIEEKDNLRTQKQKDNQKLDQELQNFIVENKKDDEKQEQLKINETLSSKIFEQPNLDDNLPPDWKNYETENNESLNYTIEINNSTKGSKISNVFKILKSFLFKNK